jgi:hypothetical protein
MKQVLRESSFLVKDYYKCIQPTDSEILMNEIPNRLLTIPLLPPSLHSVGEWLGDKGGRETWKEGP